MPTGTHTIADLSQNVYASTTIQEFGLENLNGAIQLDLAMHNERTTEMLREIADISEERSTVYGTNAQMDAVQKDEFTRAPTQRIQRGGKVEFPLDGFEIAVGWTAEYLRRATVQDMALKTIATRQAHLRRIQYDIKTALFTPTNRTWTDRLVDNIDLGVKALVNADSAQIPNGPNGETFNGATHTHYDAVDWASANDAARVAAVRALINDVREHGHGSDLRIYINVAQETDFRGLSAFVGLSYPNVILPDTATRTNQTLNIAVTDNRVIGYFDGVPVWTKPWVPANYVFCYAAGDPGKPLRMRISRLASERGLFIAADLIVHPLQAQYMNFYHGFGGLTRTNGAILYLGAGTYAAPTLTM